MAEIKSTLDLVLEKTRHLSLSSREKREITKQELEKRIKGMLQKYQDGILTPAELETEYRSIAEEDIQTADRVLVEEIVGRLDLRENNAPLFEALTQIAGFDTAGLESVADESRDAYRLAAERRSMDLKNMLSRDYRISGSAVVPNLAVDEPWQRQEREIAAGFKNSLDHEREEMLTGKSP